MKTRLRDRILIPIVGVLLLAVAVSLLLETFFAVSATTWLGQLMKAEGIQLKLLICLCCLVLIVLAAYCVGFLFRRQGAKKMIRQKRDGTEVSISVQALDSLVRKCLEPHLELNCSRVVLENHRDGLWVGLSGDVVLGTNIPELTDQLQREIRTYIKECTGVTVGKVSLQVERMRLATRGSHPIKQAEPAGETRETAPVKRRRLLRKKKEKTDSEETPDQAPETETAEQPDPVATQETREEDQHDGAGEQGPRDDGGADGGD